VLVYDVATNSWHDAAPLPAPRGGHAAVVLEGKIHVLGGGNSVSTLADHSVYDPATDRWTERAPLPRAKGSPAAVALDGRIYAIGGRSGPADFGDVDVYEPAADAWRPGPPIEPRGTAGAAVYCGTIWVFGGESQARKETLATVLRLDPATGRWRSAPPMPTARSYARAVLRGDAVYVVGGSPEPGSSHSSAGSAVVERFRARCAR
jgi:N-acetylneuraminic acid mutarotase